MLSVTWTSSNTSEILSFSINVHRLKCRVSCHNLKDRIRDDFENCRFYINTVEILKSVSLLKKNENLLFYSNFNTDFANTMKLLSLPPLSTWPSTNNVCFLTVIRRFESSYGRFVRQAILDVSGTWRRSQHAALLESAGKTYHGWCKDLWVKICKFCLWLYWYEIIGHSNREFERTGLVD